MGILKIVAPFQAERAISLFEVAAPGSTLRLVGVFRLVDGTFRAGQVSARSLFVEAVDARVLPSHDVGDPNALRGALAGALTRDGFSVSACPVRPLPLGILEAPATIRELEMRCYEALLDFSRLDARSSVFLHDERRDIRLAIVPSLDDRHACLLEVAEYAGRSRTRFAQAFRREDASAALDAATRFALEAGLELVAAPDPVRYAAQSHS